MSKFPESMKAQIDILYREGLLTYQHYSELNARYEAEGERVRQEVKNLWDRRSGERSPYKSRPTPNIAFGVRNGTGNVLRGYTVEISYTDKLAMCYWLEDFDWALSLIQEALTLKEDNIAKSTLGQNPSEEDITLFTIAALIRTRSNKRSVYSFIQAGIRAINPFSRRNLSDYGDGKDICIDEAILVDSITQELDIEGEIKVGTLTSKNMRTHNYWQAKNGQIIDISACPHRWGFISDPETYQAEIAKGHVWKKNKPSTQSEWDKKFREASRKKWNWRYNPII